MVETTTESSRARVLNIEVPGWEGHHPGQYVEVRLRTGDESWIQRSYSIASSPDDAWLSLLVTRSGGGGASRYLVDRLEEGDELELRGPIGSNFIWKTGTSEPLLLVAGGCGIAPLMAVIRHRGSVGSDVPTRLLYSSRSYDDVIYKKELDRLAQVDKSLAVIYTLTRARPPRWTGYHRRIDRQMLDEVAWRSEDNPLAFVCGPIPFVQTVATSLAKLGYERIRFAT